MRRMNELGYCFIFSDVCFMLGILISYSFLL